MAGVSHHRLAVEALHFSYPDGTVALKGVGFTALHGESVALVGANGAGKSTLLQQLNGVLLPASGRVVVGEIPVACGTLDTIRRTVGTVFQDPDDQLFMPSVVEDVAFGPRNLGLSAMEARERAEDCLREVDAAHLASRPPYSLSGGEKRRVAIAAVLAMAPDILVLDEPSTGLDPRARRQVIELLRAFTHTKLIATHDLELVLELCPRTVMLQDGTVIADGATRDLLSNAELLERCRLERPASLRPCPACGHTAVAQV